LQEYDFELFFIFRTVSVLAFYKKKTEYRYIEYDNHVCAGIM